MHPKVRAVDFEQCRCSDLHYVMAPDKLSYYSYYFTALWYIVRNVNSCQHVSDNRVLDSRYSATESFRLQC